MAVLFSLFAYLAIVAGLLSYIAFRCSRRRLYKLAEPIVSGRPELPLIGNAHQFAGSTEDITRNLFKITEKCYECDGVTKTWLGPKLYIALTNPEDSYTVLNTEMKKDAVYRFLSNWLGNGLVTGPVPIWKVHRKTISPAFNPKILDGFVSIFAEQGELLVKNLSTEIGKGQFDLFKYISLCTLDIICESAMGVKVRAQNNENASYIQAGLREMSLVYKRMFQIWLQPESIFKFTHLARQEKQDLKTLHTFTDKVVQTKRIAYKQRMENENLEYVENKKFKPFLDLMMECTEKGNSLTDVELREEVDTMTIAGNDTSAHAISFVLTMLASMPHIQEKVVDELREIYGDSDRPVERDDLPKMQYLERVIKETMRLYPIVPLVVRELTQDVKIRNFTLPAGAGVVVLIAGMHRDKEIWGENANEFDPDRFLPENSAKRHPQSYIPFSTGPRNCIGKQYAMYSVKSLVSTVIRSYKVSSNIDYKNIPVKAEIILKPVKGHRISIEPRLKL